MRVSARVELAQVDAPATAPAEAYLRGEVIPVPAEPLVFISHKHSDSEIARKLADFVRNRSAGRVRVHLSSSADFEGPRIGQPLNAELRRALADSDVVILVYTSETEDWSWCMWECGVATDPSDQRQTAVAVVQCGATEPKPFGDQVRVDIREFDTVQTFVRTLLTTCDFFPRRDEPITGFAPESPEIRDYAVELHEALVAVAPPEIGVDLSVPRSAYLRLRLTDSAVEDLLAASQAHDEPARHKTLVEQGVVSEEKNAGNLFGLDLRPGATLGEILANWRDNVGDVEPRWFASLVDQVENAIVGRFRPVPWAPYRTIQGRADVPFVASSRKVASGVEFEVFLLPISPRPVSVRERMLPIEQTYHKDVATDDPATLTLAALIADMKGSRASRLPVLDAGSARSIVHLATINDFLVGTALESGSVDGSSLADLLAARGSALAGSFVEVPPDATMEDARAAMLEQAGCQDVFVVENGVVIGWITNVMFIPD